MPVEIKELIIRTTVNDDSKEHGSEVGMDNTSDYDHIISVCVDQVMEILKEKKER